jgi:hypothetical protein
MVEEQSVKRKRNNFMTSRFSRSDSVFHIRTGEILPLQGAFGQVWLSGNGG